MVVAGFTVGWAAFKGLSSTDAITDVVLEGCDMEAGLAMFSDGGVSIKADNQRHVYPSQTVNKSRRPSLVQNGAFPAPIPRTILRLDTGRYAASRRHAGDDSSFPLGGFRTATPRLEFLCGRKIPVVRHGDLLRGHCLRAASLTRPAVSTRDIIRRRGRPRA